MELSQPGEVATHERLVARFGDGIEPWWQALPELVDRLAARWALGVGDVVGRGGTSIVLRATDRAGSPAYLKVTPDTSIAAAEATALDRWRATGRVPLVCERDLAAGALLLEAVGDGEPLAQTGAAPSLEAIAQLVAALHGAGQPVAVDTTVRDPDGAGIDVPPLSIHVAFIFDRLTARYRATAPSAAALIGDEAVARGRALGLELAATAPLSVLIHGDLHAGNVLAAGPGDSLVAIDPRPHRGDPAFDLVDWIAWQADSADWPQRAHGLAGLTGLDGARVWAWFTSFAALLALIEVGREGHVTARATALLAAAA